MNPKILKQITSIIDDNDDMTIATVRPDGYPQATTVSYVNDGLTIYFGTSTESQKAQNVARNNKVSLTIDRPYDTWDDIESLSIGGVATRLSDPVELKHVGDLLLSKFPQIADLTVTEVGAEEADFYRIDPQVISLLDYSKGFGHTEFVTLPPTI